MNDIRFWVIATVFLSMVCFGLGARLGKLISQSEAVKFGHAQMIDGVFVWKEAAPKEER